MRIRQIVLITLVSFWASSAFGKGSINDGFHKIYDSKAGPLQKIVHHEKLLRNGYYFEYFESGEIKNIGYYKDNRLSGHFKSYFENGALHYDEHYESGQLNGESRYYFPNGNLRAEAHFRNDKLHGIVKIYSQLGELSKMHVYHLGRIVNSYVYPQAQL